MEQNIALKLSKYIDNIMFFNKRQYLIKRYVNDETIKSGLHGDIKGRKLLNNISSNGQSCKVLHRYGKIVVMNSSSKN